MQNTIGKVSGHGRPDHLALNLEPLKVRTNYRMIRLLGIVLLSEFHRLCSNRIEAPLLLLELLDVKQLAQHMVNGDSV